MSVNKENFTEHASAIDYKAYIRDHVKKREEGLKNEQPNQSAVDYKAALQEEIKKKEQNMSAAGVFGHGTFAKNHPNIKTLKQYLEEVYGRDPLKDYLSKSTTTFQLVGYRSPELGISGMSDPDNFDLLVTRETSKPEIKITFTPGYCFLDLIFVSAMDPELKLFYDEFENFGSLTSMFQSTQVGYVPFASIQVMADKFIGESYLCFSNPIYWVLTHEKTGSDNANVIRILFKENDMDVIMINPEEEDINMLEEAAYVRRTISEYELEESEDQVE